MKPGESRSISRLDTSKGIPIFVYKDGSVQAVGDITISLYEEVQALRYYGNKDCTAMADAALDKVRK